jgi:hypothetical protein
MKMNQFDQAALGLFLAFLASKVTGRIMNEKGFYFKATY